MNEDLLITDGQYQDEKQSAQHFDKLIEESGLFRSYSEVAGFYLQLRPGQELKTPRLDRLLIPKPELIKLGWEQGILGVELKRSGVKAGPFVAQLLDYSRAVWRLCPAGGIDFMLRWIFLWPLPNVHCTWASMMAQNRLGNCHSPPWAKLVFKSGEQSILEILKSGSVTLGKPNCGNRTGSR